ncbi:MAG: AmmeMemoRadiSam system protein A [Candidatus Beckwithbacteria bacterium]|nr:AmmeMemoRadiSam system protein A [Candidatus Beckwithbacteria bacterium]
MNNEELAFRAISHYLKTEQVLEIKPKKPVGACFVTLYINGRLRGCIGTPEAFEPLEKNIIRNAIEAATADWRFNPVTQDELPRLTLEVSVLTPLKPYHPKSTASLLSFLSKDKPGLVIEQSGKRALFLPQVWKELPEPKEFVTQLCLKAGLSPTAWQDKNTEFFIFTLKTVSRQ